MNAFARNIYVTSCIHVNCFFVLRQKERKMYIYHRHHVHRIYARDLSKRQKEQNVTTLLLKISFQTILYLNRELAVANCLPT